MENIDFGLQSFRALVPLQANKLKGVNYL